MSARTESQSSVRTVVFAAGFRPFFLLAGIQAALIMPLWLAQYLGGLDERLRYSPVLWHGHEMVFGFGAAAVAGFLLTAVPSWTGASPVRGAPLAAVTGLWLAARVAMSLGGLLPPWVGAALSLPFLPVLGVLLGGPLIGAGKLRNIAFLPILAVLTLGEAMVFADMLGYGEGGITGLFLGIFVLLLMIAIVGGRIIPNFTVNGLRRKGVVLQPRTNVWLDRAAIAALVVAAAAFLFMENDKVVGGLLILAGMLHAIRLAGWGGLKTLGEPLLWVLHLGYAWLAAGLILLGVSQFSSLITPQIASHAMTSGCIGLMTLGVMSRAALGHSGRPLRAAPLTVAAYVLVALAALARVAGVLAEPRPALWLAGILWSAGFALYVVVYAPICLGPRADEQAG